MFDEQHALNNLEYAYLQLGETKKARGVIEQIDQIAKSMPGGDPWEPIDARIYFDVETRDWQDAMRLEPPPKSAFDENFDVYWIHSIAEARLGKPEARSSLEQFRKSSTEWISGHGWGDVMHLALAEVEAWTLYAEGRKDDALRELVDASAFEKDHPIYYADVLPRPASGMLGDMLLQMGKQKECVRHFKPHSSWPPTLSTQFRACAIVRPTRPLDK